MIISNSNLTLMFEGFKLNLNQGIAGAASHYQTVAMTVPSTTRTENYGWLAEIADIREWLGDRLITNLSTHGYAIENRDWEQTIGVDRNSIMDDQYGVFGQRFKVMGERIGEFADRLCFELLQAGFATACYDSQYFFDSDHPVLSSAGVISSKSNMQAGSAEPWFLFDTSKVLKPMIYQLRKPFDLVAKDKPGDDNVFFQKKFIYGVDGRANAGFGLWQLAFGSKDTLSAANYKAARTAMMELEGDFGRKLGIRPTLLMCGPSNEEAALKLLNSEYGTGGESNPWKGTTQLVVTPWLAA